MSTSFFGLDLATRGLSFYAVPAHFVLALLPNVYVMKGAPQHYDVAYPRTICERITKDESLDKATRARLLRAKASSENAFETLGFFAAGVVAANVAGVDAAITNAITFSVLGFRALHIFTYIVLQENRSAAPLRSIVWTAIQAGTSALFVLAARAMSIWPRS